MNVSRLNAFLALGLAGVLLAALWRRDMTRPNAEFLPDMKYTPAFQPYSRHAQLPGGKTWQPPVAGTAYRGARRLPYAATADDALRAGEELTNPWADLGEAREASIERGGKVFRTFCAACHGPGGKSDGPVAQRGYPPPPSLLTGKSTKVKDGQIYHIVALGQNTMPGFAAQISHELRWDVVNFVRSLQAAEPALESPPQEAAPADKPPAEKGNGADGGNKTHE